MGDSPPTKRYQDAPPPAPSHLSNWDHRTPQSSCDAVPAPPSSYLAPGAVSADNNNFSEQPGFDLGAIDLDGMLDLDLNLGMNFDASTLPNFLEDTAPLHHFDNFWLSFVAALAEIYDRSRTPPSEAETIEPRQYHPPANGVDAQLIFPDMTQIPIEQVDQENLAHVQEVSEGALDDLAELARTMQSTSTYPPFLELRLPPTRVINAWVQLYFEHFHPSFLSFISQLSAGPTPTCYLHLSSARLELNSQIYPRRKYVHERCMNWSGAKAFCEKTITEMAASCG
ncbi:hypothetical protein BDW66DRAFT_155500 [Aspergillus desertorum]